MLFSFRELIKIFFVPFSVFSLHVFFGLTAHIYVLWPWFDVPMHFAGGASVGFGTWIAIRILQHRGFLQNTPLLLSMFFLIAVVALSAVLWEFVEFAGDRFLGAAFPLRPLQGSLTDTMGDLGFGLLGGVIVGGYALFFVRRSVDNLAKPRIKQG